MSETLPNSNGASAPEVSSSADGSPLPMKWAEYVWPDWVPAEVREQIESFWSEQHGRSPREWEKSCREYYNGHPTLGTRVTCESDAKWWRDSRSSDVPIEGRWVPCWNNIGRLITDNGVVHVRSTNSFVENTEASNAGQ